MNNTQTFLVELRCDTVTITGLNLLRILLGFEKLPESIQAISLGTVQDAPHLWEKNLREFAEQHGLQIVERVPA